MMKQIAALFGFALLAGCADTTDQETNLPATSETVLHSPPDFIPKPAEVPNVGETEPSGIEFRIDIAADGTLYRKESPTSLQEIVDELRDSPNVDEITVMIYGDAAVRVSAVSKLQSDLAEAIPELKATVFTVVDTPKAE